MDTRSEQPQLEQPSRDLVLPQSGYLAEFDNGLKLFVLPDPYTRLVQFDVRQQVGSRDDPEGKSGLAHFVEHLMFQIPVDGAGSPKIMSALPQHALTFNAYTSLDETHYMHTGTADELETYMKYTALRLGYDCDAVSEEAFHREREVVRNEHRWRGQGVDALVYDALTELVFPPGHPYRRTRKNDDPQIASITPEDACKFVERFYTAGQATVVVSGDVEPAEVLALAKEYLEPLPTMEHEPRAPVPPLKLTEHTGRVEAPVRKPTAAVLFPMPERFSADYTGFLAAQETLFLSISFFIDSRTSVIEDWYPTVFGGEEGQMLAIAIETKKARDLDRGVDEVLDAITRGFSANLKGEEYRGAYDSARQRARLQVLQGMSNVMSRSNMLADYLEEPTDTPGFYGGEIARLDDLTTEQAQAIGRKIFARNRAMVVEVVPDGSGEAPQAERASFDYEPEEEESLSLPDDIDPAEAHRPLPFQDIAPPQMESLEFELDNGMQVVLVQASKLPVMDVQLIIGAGQADATKRAEIAEMAAYYYDVDRYDRDASTLFEYFQLAGGIFQRSVGPSSTTFRTRGLSIYLDFLLAGMSERVVQAQYADRSIEQWKDTRKEALEKKSVLQAAERQNIFHRALYGEGHPHVREQITDPKKLRDVNFRDVDEFRKAHYRAEDAALIVTGGFDMNLVISYIQSFFGEPTLRDRKNTWLEPVKAEPDPPTPEPKPGNVRTIVEVDAERAQTDVTIAYPMAEIYGDDHAAALVVAEMLNFRVGVVRKELGASYGVYARADVSRPRMLIGGALDSARAGEGYAAIRQAIEALEPGEEFDKLFAFARRQVVNQMINAQGDPQLLANQLAEAVRNGRSYDYFQQLARRVARLTPEQALALRDRVLVPERSVTLVQGPQAGVDDLVRSQKLENVLRLPDVVHDEDE